jgi:hypothetical protein
VPAPLAVSVTELPAHIEVVELEILTVGNGTTVTEEFIELVQVPLLPTIV